MPTRPFTMTSSVTEVKRLTNSAAGNPRYALTFANGVRLTTKTNAGFVFGVSFDRLVGSGEFEIDIVADKITDIRPA